MKIEIETQIHIDGKPNYAEIRLFPDDNKEMARLYWIIRSFKNAESFSECLVDPDNLVYKIRFQGNEDAKTPTVN